MTVYLTPYDTESLNPTADSQPIPGETLIDAAALLGAKIIKNRPKMVILSGGLCLTYFELHRSRAAIPDTRAPRSQTRAELLAVALEMARESGYPLLTCSNVAKRAQVSRPYCWELLGDKDALHKAVIREAVRVKDKVVIAQAKAMGALRGAVKISR